MSGAGTPRPEWDESLVSAYLDGELDASARAQVEVQLGASSEARDALDDVRFARDALRALPLRAGPRGSSRDRTGDAMKRVALLALALAVVFAFGVGPLFGSTEPRRGDGAARRLYERSQLAASQAAFSGVIAIQWRGRSGVHQATVHAVRVGGVLQVDGKGGRLL